MPIPTKKDALKVIPGLFEEFIDITEKSFYLKQLSSNRYLAFAYDEKSLIAAFENAHIELKNVKRIYFAQIEFLEILNDLPTPYVEIEGVSFSLSNEILVKIPENIPIRIENKIDITSIELSNESIMISSYSHYIDPKTAKIGTLFLGILTLFFSLLIGSNFNTIQKYNDTIEQIETMNPKSFSTIQLKSISKKYEKNFENQMEIRKLFTYVLEMNRHIKIELIFFEFENNILTLKILKRAKQDSQIVQKIERYVGKKYKNHTVSNGTNFIKVEVRL